MWVSHTAKLVQPHPATNSTGMLRKEDLWSRSTQAPGAALGPLGQGILSFRVLGTWRGGGCRLWVDMSLGTNEHFIPRGCYAHDQGKSSHYPDLRAMLVLLEHTWYIVNAQSVGRRRERDGEQEIE